MPVPSRRLKELIEGTVDHHASQRWPALEEVAITWRGSYGYLTGYLSDSDDDTRQILREVSALIRQLTRLTGGPDEGPPMTNTQRLALYELAVEGPRRLNDLADRMGVSDPTASRAVDALVDLGLVERVADPDDRRALQIDVTGTGRARAAERETRVSAAFQPAIAELSAAERAQLTDLLARLTASLRR